MRVETWNSTVRPALRHAVREMIFCCLFAAIVTSLISFSRMSNATTTGNDAKPATPQKNWSWETDPPRAPAAANPKKNWSWETDPPDAPVQPPQDGPCTKYSATVDYGQLASDPTFQTMPYAQQRAYLSSIDKTFAGMKPDQQAGYVKYLLAPERLARVAQPTQFERQEHARENESPYQRTMGYVRGQGSAIEEAVGMGLFLSWLGLPLWAVYRVLRFAFL